MKKKLKHNIMNGRYNTIKFIIMMKKIKNIRLLSKITKKLKITIHKINLIPWELTNSWI